MVGWLAGWSAGWLVGLSVGWLVKFTSWLLVGRLVGWLVKSRLVGLLLVDRSVDQLVACLVGGTLSFHFGVENRRLAGCSGGVPPPSRDDEKKP